MFVNRLVIKTIHLPKIINSFKTALACLIGYLLYLYSPLPQSQWIIITVLVVMSAQATLGGILIKAKMRLLGTICGAIVSILVIILCKNDTTAVGIALFISIVIFTFIASRPGDISYAGTLGSVTVVIILLTKDSNLTIAAERFFEIIMGILLSFLVSYLIFPIRSHSLFINNLADSIKYLGDYFEQCFSGAKIEQSSTLDQDEKMLGFFSQQKRLIYETGLEIGKSRKDKNIFKYIFDIERRIYRIINIILYSLKGINDKSNASIITNFEKKLANCFSSLSISVKTGILKYEEIVKALDDLEQTAYHQMAEINADEEYKQTFLFSLKLLINELRKLNDAIIKINYLKKSKII